MRDDVLELVRSALRRLSDVERRLAAIEISRLSETDIASAVDDAIREAQEAKRLINEHVTESLDP